MLPPDETRDRMPFRRGVTVVVLIAAMLASAACSHHERKIANDAMDDSVATPADASSGRGKALFAMQCAVCHSTGGSGEQIGPSLRLERKRKDRQGVIDAIEHPSPPMPKLFPGRLTSQDVADLAAYVESL
jgi:mono/diheme cytochrome c family protein